MLIVLTKMYQGLGAAFVWLLLNVGYVAICVPLTHRRILRGQVRRWYLDDVGRPLLIASVIVASARAGAGYLPAGPLRLIVAGLAWVATMLVCARMLPAMAALAARLMGYASRPVLSPKQ
jgi:hypothetical protein